MRYLKSILIIFAVFVFQQLSAQCYPDRHNSTWYDAWVSCEEAENPNSERGMSHWVMYDLNNLYGLGLVHLWNINDNNHLDWGAQLIAIDYSVDGENWIELDVVNLGKSDGSPVYEGIDVADFEGSEARFVLFTLLENWGGECSGIAEMRIDVVTVIGVDEIKQYAENVNVDVYPNPSKDLFKLDISTNSGQKIEYFVYDNYGRELLNKKIEYPHENNSVNLDLSKFKSGSYTLIIKQGTVVKHKSLIKL